MSVYKMGMRSRGVWIWRSLRKLCHPHKKTMISVLLVRVSEALDHLLGIGRLATARGVARILLIPTQPHRHRSAIKYRWTTSWQIQRCPSKNQGVFFRIASTAGGAVNNFCSTRISIKPIFVILELLMDSAIIIHKGDPHVPPKFIVLQSAACPYFDNTSAQSMESFVGSNASSEFVFLNESVSPNTQQSNELMTPNTHQPTSMVTQSSMRTVYACSSAVTPKRVEKLPQQPESPKQQCGICCCCCYWDSGFLQKGLCKDQCADWHGTLQYRTQCSNVLHPLHLFILSSHIPQLAHR